jgi:Baseplate J-like protein
VTSAAGDAPPPVSQRDLPVIAVDAEDDVAAVCGKMDSRREPQVVVYIRRTATFRDALSFNRIRRHAYLTGKQALVVSPNQGVRVLAAAAGIPTFGSVREAERWAAGPRRLRILGRDYAIPWIHRKALTLLSVVVGGFVVLLVAACALVPSATITLSPALTPVELQNFEATADADFGEVDIDDQEIPAARVQSDITVELAVEATGSGTLGDAPATGTVTLFNLSLEEVVVPLGTQVQTANQVAFETTEDVTLLAEADFLAPAPIVAVEPGTSGNVDAGAINEVLGDLSEQVAALNNEPTGGGTDREARVVQQEDIDKLNSLVSGAAQQRGLEALIETYEENAEDKRVIFLETVDSVVLGTDVSPGLGEEADFVFAETSVRVRALTVRYADIQAYTAALMNGEQGNGMGVSPGTVVFNITGVDEESISETLSALDFTFQASAAAGPFLDEDEVKGLVKGKTEEAAMEALEERYELAEPPQIDINPSWVDWVPRFDFRLDVDVRLEP